MLFLGVPVTLSVVPTDTSSAIAAVNDLLHERRWNAVDLAREADLDNGTVGDFLGGVRWPRSSSRGAMEAALSLRPGALGRIAGGHSHLSAERRDQEVAERPVGLGLDDEANDLRPEQVEAVRAMIRAMKPPLEGP